MGYAQDLVNQGYGGYQGWGDAEARADFSATGGGGKKTGISAGSGGMGGGYSDIAQSQLKLQQDAAAPAIQTLQNQIPEINKSFDTQVNAQQGRKTALSDRYDALVNKLVGEQSTATSREFGRRGIPLSSGLFDSTLLSQTNPIRTQVNTEKEAGLADIENLIATLGSNRSGQLSQVSQAIAGLQSGAAKDALTQALQLYQTNQANDFNQQQLAQQAKQSADEMALQKLIYNNISLPQSKSSIAAQNALTANRTANVANTDIGSGLDELFKQFSK